MTTLMKFKSVIQTEQIYPNKMILEYVIEVHNAEDVFAEAMEFEAKTINGKIISATTTCLGIVSVRQAKFWELSELAKQGIETLH